MDPDEKFANKVHNEGQKLLAGYLNGVAVILLGAGVLIPAAAVVAGTATVAVLPTLLLVTASFGLHAAARGVGKNIRPEE